MSPYQRSRQAWKANPVLRTAETAVDALHASNITQGVIVRDIEGNEDDGGHKNNVESSLCKNSREIWQANWTSKKTQVTKPKEHGLLLYQ